jgi:hypothetical protein
MVPDARVAARGEAVSALLAGAWKVVHVAAPVLGLGAWLCLLLLWKRLRALARAWLGGIGALAVEGLGGDGGGGHGVFS